jgi:hypothetical protein
MPLVKAEGVVVELHPPADTGQMQSNSCNRMSQGKFLSENTGPLLEPNKDSYIIRGTSLFLLSLSRGTIHRHAVNELIPGQVCDSASNRYCFFHLICRLCNDSRIAISTH